MKEKVPKRLEDRLREVMRLRQMSLQTEECYVGWCRRFVLFHKKRHPETMGAREVEAFLTDLAVRGNVAASTQNQALNAVLFLYKNVLEMEVEGINALRAKERERIPVVLTKDEVKRLLGAVTGECGVMCRLLYGCGLRVAEVLALRIKDVDIEGGKLEVRGGKGDKDCRSRLLRLLCPSGFAALRLSRA